MTNYCGSSYTGYANEQDWLMTLWDYCTNYSTIDFDNVIDTLVEIDGDCDSDYESGSWNNNDNVLYCRALEAATCLGFASQFGYVSNYNGVNYYYCP